MSKRSTIAIVTVAAFAIAWAVVGFVLMQFNPAVWTETCRVNMLMLAFAMLFPAVGIIIEGGGK
jgi:hypothetical protein